MKTMVPRSPISGKTYAEIEQERAKTNATATIKRAGSSKVDEVADSGAIKQEGPGVIERVSARASTLRGGIGKKTARVQEAIATAREDRAGEAAIQATLKKVATGTGETLPTATDTAGMTAEQRKQRFVETIQASYDRKGVTVPSAVTTPIEVAPDAAKPTDQPSPLK
jgi:hypothetical protein